MKKCRILVAMVALAALLISFLGLCMAESISEVEPASPADFVYVSNGSEIQINEYIGKGGFVKIPDEIEGVPVTRIGDNVFNENDTITGVILPKYLTYIGDSAFYWCRNLSGVLFIPPSVKTVKNAAFCGSTITGLIVSADCEFESQTFMYCDELEFVYITEGSSPKLGWLALWNQDKLKTAIVPNTVEIIHEKNFGKSNLLTIYTPDGSTAQKFAQERFINCNCDQYEAIQREYDQKYNEYFMGNNVSVDEPTIANKDDSNVEQIRNADGGRISDLYTYSIKGNGTVSIIDYDWSKSSGEIYIPTMLDGYSVTAIGDEAFADGKEVSKEKCLVVIPESITLIGEKAFFNSPVSSVSIPNSIKSIGKAAFAYCDITQFIIDQKQPNYTTVDGVLYDKRNKSLLAYPQKKAISNKIPEGILSISEYAFSGMTIGQKNSGTLSFTDILPSTLTKIEPHAFENCTLYYSSNETTDNSLTLLPKGLSEIGEYAFAGCVFKSNHSAPEKIVLAEELDEIGDYAFSDCKFSDDFDFELVISKSEMSRIGKHAFASSVTGNQKMNVRIVLPDAVDEIGENAFFETHPVRINEKAEIRTLGTAAFQNTIVYTEMQGSNGNPTSLSIFGKMKKIPSTAFADKPDDYLNTVETIIIQEGITIIGESAFACRKNLQTVSLPMTLTEIGSNAFSDCSKLLEITVPESVMKIGDNAFDRQYITLIVTENSYAALWASENGYNYRYVENNDDLDWLNSDIH